MVERVFRVLDMAKKESRELVTFKREFERYQNLFGLTGYKIYFEHVPLNDNFAQINCNQHDMCAAVRLNSEPHPAIKSHSNPKRSAKHEAIHLMLNKITDLATQRYIKQGEIYEAEEELVYKLENLIP